MHLKKYYCYLKNITRLEEDKPVSKRLILKCNGIAFAYFFILATFTSFTQASTLHEPWNTLLAQHVSAVNNGHNTAVNYSGFLAQRNDLRSYLQALEQISQAEFTAFDDAEQLAFLLNAYNAWTIELILTEYPNLESIRDLGSLFSSPWKKSFIPLLGKKRSLDDIEHDLIRGENKYNEPRIHFAVNCASIGCPALREEAYVAVTLNAQLEAQTLRFMSDKSRNKVENNTLYLSSIFKWYKDDFELGFKGANSLSSFVLLYKESLNLTIAEQSSLESEDMKIRYLDYDWHLNDLQK